MGSQEANATVETLASWSQWVPFMHALEFAPRVPGVYMFGRPSTGDVIYVGMAGERAGSGSAMQGLRGRLTVYGRGRGAVSGFGEAALDRALADPDWIAAQLEALRTSGAKRTKVWAREAIEHLAPQVRWATRETGAEARELEGRIVSLLAPHGLWNRAAAAAKEAPSADLDPVELLTVRGHTIDLDVLYRQMHRHSMVGPDGVRVFVGNSPDVPAMKRLLHSLFGVPVRDGIDPVNNAVRSAARDRLGALGWAIKDVGHSGRYVLRRDL